MSEGENFWGGLLRDLRAEQRVTQRALAAQTGVNRATIRRIELGLISPPLRVMECLLDHLGYEIEAIERVGVDERLRLRAAREHDPNKRSELALIRLLMIGNTLPIMY